MVDKDLSAEEVMKKIQELWSGLDEGMQKQVAEKLEIVKEPKED